MMERTTSKVKAVFVCGPMSPGPNSTFSRKFKSRPASARAARPEVASHGASVCDLLQKPFLAIEIGCGVGLHPIQYSSEHPDRALIAIERTVEKFASFVRRLDHHPELKKNLSAVHADAFQFLDENFPDASIDEAWILYPNPEPKRPNRRWFYTPFTGRLVELLKDGAKVFLATNVETYARDCEQMAARYDLIKESSESFTRLTRPDWKPRTHFEKKYFERGEIITDLTFRYRR